MRAKRKIVKMNQELLNKVESGQLRKEPLEFAVGDSVKVHTRVVEGDKERKDNTKIKVPGYTKTEGCFKLCIILV